MKNKFEEISENFKALAHPTRLAIIVGLIKCDECNVTKMVEKLGLPQPNISQHLTILKNAGIIKGYRQGSEVCYRVINEPIKKIIKELFQENLCHENE